MMASIQQQPSAPVPILSEQEAAAISMPVSFVVIADWTRMQMTRVMPVMKICCKKQPTVTTQCRPVLNVFSVRTVHFRLNT